VRKHSVLLLPEPRVILIRLADVIVPTIVGSLRQAIELIFSTPVISSLPVVLIRPEPAFREVQVMAPAPRVPVVVMAPLPNPNEVPVIPAPLKAPVNVPEPPLTAPVV